MKTLENTDNAYQESIDLSNENEILFNERNQEALEEKRANEAVKGAAWLLGIVAVFALAILITWIIGSQSPFLDRSIEREAAVWNNTKPLKAQISKSASNANAQFIAHITSGNNSNTNIVTSKNVQPSVSEATANAVSSADIDRIEREAREVIHGDYGVNPGRKAKLGADYAAVQARVNELLH